MEEEIVPHELKEKINSFLWCWLPPDATLAEGEVIAAELHSRMEQLYKEVAARRTGK